MIQHEDYFEDVPCILCNTREERLLFELPDYNQRCPGLFRLIRCRRCGLVYLNPRPSPKAISRYYPLEGWVRVKEHTALEKARVNGRPWRQIMARRASPILKRRTRGRVLEIGSGDGLFLKYLSEMGWECVGIEPSPEASQYAREVCGVSVQTGTLDQFEFPPHSFDVTMCYASIEHLPNPLRTLERLRELVRDDGLIYIGSIPNFNSFERFLFGKRWVHLNAPRHLYHFTYNTFGKVLKKAGLHIVTSGMFSYEGQSVIGYTDSLRHLLRDLKLPLGQKRPSREFSQGGHLFYQNGTLSTKLKEIFHHSEYVLFRVLGHLADLCKKGSFFWVTAEKDSDGQ